MGITGTREAVSAGAASLVRRTREHTGAFPPGLPVAVGLGVSTPERPKG
jgi:tryptophan synthase alpha subunit